MTVWRITPVRHVKDLKRGLGGLYAAGRWHEKGVPILYASDHPSTALLELLVNASAAKLKAGSYVVVPVGLPDGAVRTVAEDALPPDWRSLPHPDSTRALGMQWLGERKWLALGVPSAVFPLARNIIINPMHPQVEDVLVGTTQSLMLDERLVHAPSIGA